MDPSLYSIGATEDPAEADQQAKMMAAALRRQNAYATLGGTSPINAVRQQSPGLMKDAWQREDRLSEMPRQRLTQSLLAQQSQKIQQDNADENNPALGAFNQQVVAKRDPVLAKAMAAIPARMQGKAMDQYVKMQGMEQGDATKRYVGELAAQARATGQSTRESEAQAKADRKTSEDWARNVRMTTDSSRSPAGVARANMMRGDRALGLLDGTVADTPQNWADLATALASVSGGGAAHMELIKQMKPNGVDFDVARFKQFVTSQPQAVRATKWKEHFKSLMDVERRIMEKQIGDSVVRASVPYIDYMRANPDDARRRLGVYGVADKFHPETFDVLADMPGGGGQQQGAGAAEVVYRNKKTGERRYNKPGLNHPEWAPE